MKNYKFLKSVIVLIAFLLTPVIKAESLKNLAAALDIPENFLTGQEFIKYKYDKKNEETVVDDEGNPVVESRSGTAYWKVQTSTVNETAPYKGKSCLCSNYGSTTPSEKTDNTANRLYFTVFGPGTFSFAYKTSTDNDMLIVYVDGQEEQRYYGYGTEVYWEEDYLEINGGVNENGTYEHEIIFEFRKTEPVYWDGKYDKIDGPQEKPKWDDYKPEQPYTQEEYDWCREDYQNALAEYNSFHSCVWLDGFSWTPEAVTLDFSDIEVVDVYMDQASVSLESNASTFGYLVTYTLDGTVPAGTSESYYYFDDNGDFCEKEIRIEKQATVKAKVFIDSKTAYSPELLISRKYVIKASTPKLSYEQQADGTIKVTMVTDYLVDENDDNGVPAICLDNTQQSKNLVDRNPIHYTLDGSDPTGSGLIYNGKTGLILDKPCTIKAVAQRDGVQDSEIATLSIQQFAEPVVKTSEPYNVYNSSKGLLVTVTSDENATLQYSIDGGTTWVDFTTSFYLKSVDGQTAAEALVRATGDGKMTSKAVSVKAYPESDEYAISLKQGWNQIVFPMRFRQQIIKLVMNMGQFYSYDGRKKIYKIADSIECGQAYWVWAEQDAEIVAYGYAEAEQESIPKGWSYYGAMVTKDVDDGMIVWIYEEGKYKLVDKIVKGRSYWVFNAE